MPTKLIANAVLFQLGWFAAVLGGSSFWLLIPLGVLLVHFTWTSSWAAEGKLVMTVFFAGAALDSFLMHLGVFAFPGESDLIPLWLALLWAMLATTLNHCLAWSRRWWVAAVAGAVAAPGSYVAGAALADVDLPLGLLPSILILAAIWAVVLPVLHGFAHLYREQYRQRVLAEQQCNKVRN